MAPTVSGHLVTISHPEMHMHESYIFYIGKSSLYPLKVSIEFSGVVVVVVVVIGVVVAVVVFSGEGGYKRQKRWRSGPD